MIRVVSLLLISLTLLFSVSLSQEQLDMAKAAGISESQINEQISKTEQKVEKVPAEQKVENNIDDKANNLFKLANNKDKTSKDIKRYASHFFNNKNKINPYSIPTPSNYKLNFGDKMTLTIYGATNENFVLQVDKNGNITLPQVGEKKVIGLNFSDTKELILAETKKAYPNSTNILVDMTEFTSIQVTVSGLVSNPGIINLSSFSTIKDALISSGGILENGSYRNILLKRGGKTISTFDLYSLVRYGDTNSDKILQNGDVILVKPINKEIKLTGGVNFNAIFELKNSERFSDLIDFASGFKASANKNAIKLKRFENNSVKVYTVTSNELYKMKPKNGDEIYVYSTSDLNAKFVEIKGNVVAIGEKEIPKDKKLSTLLQDELKKFGKKGYFKLDTNYKYAVVINDNNIKSFNLKKVLDGKEDISLNNRDKIIIYKKEELQDKPYLYVNGEIVDNIKRKYDFYDGMKAKDLFDFVKFKTEKENDQGRVSIRVDKSKIQINRIQNNKKQTILVEKKEMNSFSLKPFDEITFFEYSKVNEIEKATIKGEVFIPGSYYITNNVKIKDMIDLAGGLTKKALKSKFEIVRYTVHSNERTREILSMNLDNPVAMDFEVHPDDEITIFPIVNWNDKMYVELKGLVRFPGKYPIVDGEKLSSVLQRAGGFLPNAFIEGAVFTRVEVQELQQKRLDESIDRLKMQMFSENLTADKVGENSGDKAKMLATLNALEKQAAANRPIGRVSLNLYYDLNRFQDSNYDIILKDGDVLSVPSINDTVSVVGEVLNQNTFVYDDKLDIDDYISKAGGLKTGADDEFIYVVKANGEAVKYEKNFFWQNSVDIFKGDTIVVPVKLDTMSDVAFAKDVTQIVYQIAVTAASLKTLGSL
ncbi:MAG: SLBB domain-containing protein [Halarcobacter sp.]